MSSVDGSCEYAVDVGDPDALGLDEGDARRGLLADADVGFEWTCPHEAARTVRTDAGEQALCPFHLPPGEMEDEAVAESFRDALDRATAADDPEERQRAQEFVGARFGSLELETDIDGAEEFPLTLLGARFTGDVRLDGLAVTPAFVAFLATVEGDAAFEEVTFEGTARLEAVAFEGEAQFDGATFREWASFEQTRFEESMGFVDAVFEERAAFSDVTAEGWARFNEATFGGIADFGTAVFEAYAIFTDATFKASTNFSGEFAAVAEFTDATFEDRAGFGSVVVRGRLDCEAAEFGPWPDFQEAVVSEATFERATFARVAMFDHAVLVHTTFDGATFEEGAVFRDATLFDASFADVAFADGEFSDAADGAFPGATLFDATFESATFAAPADFAGAMFLHPDAASQQPETFAELGEWAKQGVQEPAGREANANFTGVTFEQEADFTEALAVTAVFDGARFAGVATFDDAFLLATSFADATFEAAARFRSRRADSGPPFGVFHGPVDFSGATARAAVDFRALDSDDSPVTTDVVTFAEGADFTGASIAAGCTLAGATFGEPPTFRRAQLQNADCSDATLDGADLRNADLTDVTFVDASLLGADLERARLSRANLIGADLRGAALAETVLTDVRIDDTTRFLEPPVDDLPAGARLPRLVTGVLPGVRRTIPAGGYDEAFVPPADVAPDIEWPDRELNKAKSLYRAIENLAGLSSRPRLQSRAFVRRQDVQREQYRRASASRVRGSLDAALSRVSWLRASVGRWFLLYGESPWRIVGWSLFIVAGFAFLYPVGGWVKPTDGPRLTYGQIGTDLAEFGDAVYYSTLTFTALGFGDFVPVGFGRVLTTVETGLGAVLLALLVFILGRRAAR